MSRISANIRKNNRKSSVLSLKKSSSQFLRNHKKKKSTQIGEREYETFNLEKRKDNLTSTEKKIETLLRLKKHHSTSGFSQLNNYKPQTEKKRIDLKLSNLKNFFSKKPNSRKKSSTVCIISKFLEYQR